MAQKQREQMVERLKRDRLDILVATDVVARGLDVDRISLVVNYDVPYDTEAYVHRIGRTGRAGRTGEAILFVTPRERGLLGAIERATRQKIEPLTMPTVEEINAKRVADFLGRIDAVLERRDLGFLERTLADWQAERQVRPERLAAALAHLAIGDAPLLLAEDPREARKAAERERGKRREPREATAARPTATAAQPARARRDDRGGPRHGVLRQRERGARFTARSGFLAIDCRQAARGGRWRVLGCRHVDLADGGLWLVEVRAMDGRDEAGVPGWIPLPWHDWA